MNSSEPTDWDEIRRRIDASREAIEQGFSPSADEERRILKDRAQALARAPDDGGAARAMLEVVAFDLATEQYGLPLAQVREVSLLREMTPVPCTPPFILGIINLRGEIRTVIDLKQFFDLPTVGITELNKIILIEHHGWQLGVLADAIRGVRRVFLDDLQPSLPTLTDRRADYLRGITGGRLVVLDAAKILSDPRLLIDEAISS